MEENHFQTITTIEESTIHGNVTNQTIIHIHQPQPLLTNAEKIQLIRNWNIPALPNHFIGRETLLIELAQRLVSQQNETSAVVITACHGLGGVGKTFLAARYAQLYAESYAFVLWFNAENEIVLSHNYHQFAEAIQLPIEGQSSENIIIMVKNWLHQQSNWLIIYDNALDDQLIARFRPTKGGKVLITSRKESWSKKDSLAIDVFSLEESRAYIVELTGFTLAKHQATIDELAKTLGYLPLALAQACAYIVVNNLSLQEYLALYMENKAEMLADATMPAEAYHEPVAITWHITFEAIKKQQLAASSLLESCVFLQGSSIAEFLLKDIFAKQYPELTKQAKPFIDVMRCLQQYSMLKLVNQEKEKAFNMHNLVQEVMFATLSNDKKQAYLLEIIGILDNIYPCKEIEQLEDKEKQLILLPHVEKGLQCVEEWLKQLKQKQGVQEILIPLIPIIEVKLLTELSKLIAHGYRNMGNFQQQKIFSERILQIQEQYLDNHHPEIAKTLVNLSDAEISLGNNKQSKIFLERALIIQEINFNSIHSDVAKTLSSLGIVYGMLGDMEQSKIYLERSLEIRKKLFNTNHYEVAKTLVNLSIAYRALGNITKSKMLIEQALPILEQQFGVDHPEVSKTLVNLGNIYGDLGDAKQQKVYLEQALAIQEKHFNADHPEIARTLTNLGNAYGDLGDTNKQMVLLERALSILKKNFGSEHPRITKILISLGNAYGTLGDAKQQKVYLEQALAIEEKRYGLDHPEVARTLASLGNAYGDLGDVKQQKVYLERALAILEKHYGPDHPNVALTLASLGNAYGDLGDANEQKTLLERALSILERHFGTNHHPKIAMILVSLGNAVGSLGNTEQKKLLLERALNIEEKYFGSNHPRVANTLSSLGSTLRILGDIQQGKNLLEHALPTLEKHFGSDHPQVATTLANLGNAYGDLGDADKQKALLERALSIMERYFGANYHPQIATILVSLSNAIGNLGDAKQQKQFLERALMIKEYCYGPNHPEVIAILTNLSDLVLRLDNKNQYKELNESILKRQEQWFRSEHPDIAKTLVKLGIISGSLGNARQCKIYLERALKIQEKHFGINHPDVAKTLVSLNNAIGDLGYPLQQQKELLERALPILEIHYGKYHLEVGIVLCNLAAIYLQLNQCDKSKQFSERAYDILSTHPDAGLQHPFTQFAKEIIDSINTLLTTYSSEQLSALYAHNVTLATEGNSLDLAKALRNAANQNNVEKLKELLSQEIDVNTKDEGQNGRTALHWAVIKQALPCIKLLLIAGADVMMVDKAGKSSVDYAGENSIPGALFLLLNHHYKLPLEDIDAGKLLRRVAHQNKVNDIKLLLKHIKDVNEKDVGNSQRTALHWAVIQEATDCIEVLLMAGADPTIVDASGKTALDYAKGKERIFELLQRNQTMPNVQQK